VITSAARSMLRTPASVKALGGVYGHIMPSGLPARLPRREPA
jgi:hypothetical protein